MKLRDNVLCQTKTICMFGQIHQTEIRQDFILSQVDFEYNFSTRSNIPDKVIGMSDIILAPTNSDDCIYLTIGCTMLLLNIKEDLLYYMDLFGNFCTTIKSSGF